MKNPEAKLEFFSTLALTSAGLMAISGVWLLWSACTSTELSENEGALLELPSMYVCVGFLILTIILAGICVYVDDQIAHPGDY